MGALVFAVGSQEGALLGLEVGDSVKLVGEEVGLAVETYRNND